MEMAYENQHNSVRKPAEKENYANFAAHMLSGPQKSPPSSSSSSRLHHSIHVTYLLNGNRAEVSHQNENNQLDA